MNDASRDDLPLIDVRLLGALLGRWTPATIHALSRLLAMPVSEVWARIEQLRDAGCVFDEHPQQGIKLIQAGLSTWRDYLEHVTDPARLIQVFRQTTSTQDPARRMVQAHGRGAHRALVIAETQTAGRGRLGRAWIAPPGAAVTFSRVQITGAPTAQTVDQLTFAATVAAARALDVFVAPQGLRCRIKWPNDLYVDDRKIAGILVENFTTADGQAAAIIGIGINVALKRADLPEDEALRQKVTSLAMCGLRVDRLAVLGAMVEQLDAALDREDAAGLLAEWRRRCAMLHQHVHLRTGDREVQGYVIDLDPHAGLIVRSDAGALMHLPAATTTVL